MKKLIPLAIVLVSAPLALAQTMTITNSTTTSTASTTFETYPTVTSPVNKTIAANATVDTGLPTDASTLNSLELKQSNSDVAGTPLYVTGVLKVQLTSACDQGVVPPCLALTPAKTSNPQAVKDANAFLMARSTTKEFCLSGSIAERSSARWFTLANGLVVNLMGNLERVPKSGIACLCGVEATPPTPVNTISFAVHRMCDANGK